MVVKCVFVGEPIETIVGLNERRNPELIRMLQDFVAERNAAGRPLVNSVHAFLAGPEPIERC
jgi:L-ribulose-5-phosphate 3-epimerase